MPRLRTPNVRTERYAITEPAMECDCAHCGYPLTVGMACYVPALDPIADAYCTAACAVADLCDIDPRTTIARHAAGRIAR